MQIGIRVHDTKELPLEERLQVIKEQGFTCGHLALSKVISGHSVKNAALTPGFAMYIKRAFAKNELDIAVLGCYLNLANPNKEQLAEIIETYKVHIRFASILGCGVVGTETGAPNEEYRFEAACHTQEALDTFIENLRPIVAYAENMGVIVAIEPVFRHIVSNPERAREVLDRIQSPNLQIILDPVNLLDVSNYQDRESIIAEAVALLGDAAAVIHIKDFVVENGQLKSLAAGSGMMNYERILSFVKKEKPFVHVTLEDTVPENAVRARELIQSVYNEVK
ncbi:sugar phosphate isomerase/epimerase family protein [Anaerobium acetethylicum]|uniref:Sugar phosphate isomerase/epimerase n=1 Tax=Anaerobium acetethylicum TaxID=1619234 RepID=A0A1D3TVS2_9FIRM|nr:sugar phosphate isomerase/epimerase family protein [Anaerobium acetethylicum]SCP98243.1 Sugar phosphate isomerase/epimerase [Anaerobium acetethylicum]